MDAQKEAKLLQKAQQGDASSYGALVQLCQKSLYRRAIALVGQAEAAEDLLQESLLLGWRSIQAFRGESSLHTWLYRILSNKCKDYLRSSRKQSADISIDASPALVLKDERINLEKKLELSEEARYLIEKVNLLPKRYRALLLLRYYDDLSYEQIAKLTHAKVGTVKSRLFAARGMLRKMLH